MQTRMHQRRWLGDRPGAARWLSESSAPPASARPLALYALHSGQLYGTERMALATLEELAPLCRGAILTPPGPVTRAARNSGIAVYEATNPLDVFRHMTNILAQESRLVFFATGLKHSLAFALANRVARRRAQHYHVVHGGTDERLSYGRKRLVPHLGGRLVAVSPFVRERLAAHGADADEVIVFENFLSTQQRQSIARRWPRSTMRRIAVVSRVDAIKRVDVLLDAVERHPELTDFEFDVYGAGSELETLRRRAADLPNVHFHGYRDDVSARYADADVLLHLCPNEPFGLVVLEAMVAGLPVVVPDQGGAAGLVEPGVSGCHFRANDADDLARTLLALQRDGWERRAQLIAAADRRFEERYSAVAGGNAVRRWIAEGWNA